MINQSNLSEFLNLSDEQLKKRLEQAAVAAGADKNKIALMLSNPERLRGIISSLTPEDAERMIKMFGKDKAQAIADSLKNGM